MAYQTIKAAHPDLRRGQYMWLNAGKRIADWRGGWRWVTITSVGHKWVVFEEVFVRNHRIPAASVDHFVMPHKPETEEDE